MTASAPIVFIVDDDHDVRRALTRLVRSAGYRVEAFESAWSFLSCADVASAPACLVLDLQLPDMNGLELQREMKAALPIIFITGHGDIGTTVLAMQGGAADFLPKPICDTVLLETIGHALVQATQSFSQQQELAKIRERVKRLTPREREVLALLVSGRLNKQAAGELGIAEKTIKIHRARIMQKMEARSLVELIRVTDKAGVGSPGQPTTPALNAPIR